MLQGPDVVNNFCVKIAKLQLMIEKSQSLLADGKLKIDFMEKNCDKYYQEIYSNYANEVQKLINDMDGVYVAANDTYKSLYDARYNTLLRYHKERVEKLRKNEIEKMDELEVILKTLKKSIPNVIFGFDITEKLFEKRWKSIKNNINKHNDDINKETQAKKKRIDEETNEKIEKYNNDTQIKMDQIQRNLNALRSHKLNQTSYEEQNVFAIVNKKHAANLDVNFSCTMRDAKETYDLHHEFLKRYKEKLEKKIREYMNVYNGTLSKLKACREEYDKQEEMYEEKIKFLIESIHNEEETFNMESHELIGDFAEEKKRFIISQDLLVKSGLMRSQTSESFISTFKIQSDQELEYMISKFKNKEEKEQQVIDYLSSQRKELDRLNREEKERIDKELDNILELRKNEELKARTKNKKEIDELNKSYQLKMQKMNQRFDAMKVKNSQILPAVKSISALQDELSILKEAHKQKMQVNLQIYQSEENKAVSAFERKIKEEEEKMDKEYKELEEKCRKELEKEEAKTQSEIEKCKLTLHINNKIEMNHEMIHDESEYDLSKYESLILKLNNELDSIIIPEALPNETNQKEFEEKKKLTLNKLEEDKERIEKAKNELFNSEKHSKKAIEDEYKQRNEGLQKIIETAKSNHENMMNNLEDREKEIKKEIQELSHQRKAKSKLLHSDEIDELKGKLKVERQSSQDLLLSTDIFLQEAITGVEQDISNEKKHNLSLLAEEDEKFEVIHKEFKDKLSKLLERRKELREYAQQVYKNIKNQCIERNALKEHEYREELKQIRNKIEKFAEESKEHQKHREELKEKRRKNLELREKTYLDQLEDEISGLKQRRKNAINDVSTSAAAASAKLDYTKKKVDMMPHQEEINIIKNLEERLDELNQNFINVGRSMLAYHDCLGIREENYSKRFSQTCRLSSLDRKLTRFNSNILPPLNTTL